MKKQAAIYGPTPPFVAWSIRHACQLKTEIDEREPEQVERSLRAIRLAGQAIAEGRIVEDFIYAGNRLGSEQLGGKHLIEEKPSEIPDQDPKMVFRLSDITTTRGSWNGIKSACQNCPANVADNIQTTSIEDNAELKSTNGSSDNLVAGCFGWLTNEQIPGGSLDKALAECDQSQIEELQACDLLSTQPIWNGLWLETCLERTKLLSLKNLLEMAAKNPSNKSFKTFDDFRAAISVCLEQNWALDVRSFPSGNSDGQNWVIESHCSNCKATMEKSAKQCLVCQRSGGAHSWIKRKVRGLRPFVSLNELLASTEAERIAEMIEQQEVKRGN